MGGGIFDGFKLLFKSPYLGGIGLWVFLLSLLGTFLYFTQAGHIVAASPTTQAAPDLRHHCPLGGDPVAG